MRSDWALAWAWALDVRKMSVWWRDIVAELLPTTKDKLPARCRTSCQARCWTSCRANCQASYRASCRANCHLSWQMPVTAYLFSADREFDWCRSASSSVFIFFFFSWSVSTVNILSFCLDSWFSFLCPFMIYTRWFLLPHVKVSQKLDDEAVLVNLICLNLAVGHCPLVILQ